MCTCAWVGPGTPTLHVTCVCVNQLNPALLCYKTACRTLLQLDCLLHYVRSPASKDAHRHGFAFLRRRFDHHRPVLDLAFWFLGHRAYIRGILAHVLDLCWSNYAGSKFYSTAYVGGAPRVGNTHTHSHTGADTGADTGSHTHTHRTSARRHYRRERLL